MNERLKKDIEAWERARDDYNFMMLKKDEEVYNTQYYFNEGGKKIRMHPIEILVNNLFG